MFLVACMKLEIFHRSRTISGFLLASALAIWGCAGGGGVSGSESIPLIATTELTGDTALDLTTTARMSYLPASEVETGIAVQSDSSEQSMPLALERSGSNNSLVIGDETEKAAAVLEVTEVHYNVDQLSEYPLFVGLSNDHQLVFHATEDYLREHLGQTLWIVLTDRDGNAIGAVKATIPSELIGPLSTFERRPAFSARRAIGISDITKAAGSMPAGGDAAMCAIAAAATYAGCLASGGGGPACTAAAAAAYDACMNPPPPDPPDPPSYYFPPYPPPCAR